MRWPQLSVDVGWTYSNTPAIVFAQKLNAGDFAAEDFDIARLNSPDALSHLTSSLSLQLPIDVFGKVGAGASLLQQGGHYAMLYYTYFRHQSLAYVEQARDLLDR